MNKERILVTMIIVLTVVVLLVVLVLKILSGDPGFAVKAEQGEHTKISGKEYHVFVDPHAQSPIAKLTVILMKNGEVAGNIKVDPVYAQLAEQTGGSVNAMDPKKFKGDELGDHMTAVMTVSLITKDNELLFATGTGMTGKDLGVAVYMPGGAFYRGEIKDNTGSAMIEIPTPIPGDWTVVVYGNGAYELHASKMDDKDFFAVRFVEDTGGVHGGLFPIRHALTAGDPAILEVISLSDISALHAYYKLVNSELIEIPQFTSASVPQDESYFRGTVPRGSFTVLLRWTDSKTKAKMEREFRPGTIPAPEAATID